MRAYNCGTREMRKALAIINSMPQQKERGKIFYEQRNIGRYREVALRRSTVVGGAEFVLRVHPFYEKLFARLVVHFNNFATIKIGKKSYCS